MARQALDRDEVGNQVRLDVGPVAPATAAAWIAWAHEVFGEVRSGSAGASSCAELLCGTGGLLEQWTRPGHSVGGTFRWQAEVDPDELEYLIHGFLTLDAQAAAVEEGGWSAIPHEGREFYVVLMRDLLHALETEGPRRAAFVNQLRDCWPSAAEAG